jgi:hypothetical protein
VARGDDRVRVIPRISVSEELATNSLQAVDAESDLVTRIVPGVQLESAGDRGHTRLDVSLPSQVYRTFDELNSVDRVLRFDVDRRLTRRLSAFAEADWADLDATDPVEQRGLEIRDASQERRALGGTAGLRYAFSQRTVGTASLSWFDRESDVEYLLIGSHPFPDTSGNDYQGMSATVGWRHSLTQRDEVGLTLSAQEIEFAAFPAFTRDILFPGTSFDVGDRRLVNEPSTDRILLTRASWTRAWSPRWSSSFALGLRRLLSDGGETRISDSFSAPFFDDPNTPNQVLVGGASDQSYAFTGSALLRRTFLRGHLELGFSQETRPSGGTRGTQDVRALTATLHRQLSSRWSLGLVGRWSSFEAAGVSSDPREESDASDLWFARAQLDWQLRRRLTTFFAYEYLKQTGQGSVAGYTDQRLRVGFSYAYEIDVP